MDHQSDSNILIEVNEDPFTTIELWFEEAKASEPNNPEAMSLATVDKTGLPNVRTVLMRGLDGPGVLNRGLVFYTNLESAKGCELSSCPQAALLFYWKSLGRQIRVRGSVATVSDTEADAYFATRPEGSRVGAWASDQSRPLDKRATLEERISQISQKYEGGTIPRPPHWSGYRLTPSEIEFWQNGEFRLHHRLAYTRQDETKPWAKAYLNP